MEVDTRLMPNRTQVTVVPKEIADWRVGQLIDARVTSVTSSNTITLMISGREIEAELLFADSKQKPPTLQTGDRLSIEVSSQGGEKSLKVVHLQSARATPANTLSQTVEQLVREALPRQNSAAPLLRNFLYLLQPENEPDPAQLQRSALLSPNSAGVGTGAGAGAGAGASVQPDSSAALLNSALTQQSSGLAQPNSTLAQPKSTLAQANTTQITQAPALHSKTPLSQLSEKEMLEILTQFSSSAKQPSRTFTGHPALLGSGKTDTYIPLQLLQRGSLNSPFTGVGSTTTALSTDSATDRLTLLASQTSHNSQTGSQQPALTANSANSALRSTILPQATNTDGKLTPQAPQSTPTANSATQAGVTASMRSALPQQVVQTVQQLLQTLPKQEVFATGTQTARSDAIERLVRFSGLFMEGHLANLPQPTARISLNIDLLALLLKLQGQIKESLTLLDSTNANRTNAGRKADTQPNEPIIYQRPPLATLSDMQVTLPTPNQLQVMVQRWYEQLQAGLRSLQNRATAETSAPPQEGREQTQPNPYQRTPPNPFFPDAPPPPLKQFQNQPVATAIMPSILTKQLGEKELLDELEKQTDAAISRIRLGQTSLNRSEGGLQMMVDLPIVNGNLIDLFQLRIQPDESSNSETEKTANKQKGWLVELSFELPPMGPVTARIRLEQEQVSAQIWAQSPEVAIMFRQTLDHLKSSLRSIGLEVGAIDCISGEPPASTGVSDNFDGAINEQV